MTRIERLRQLASQRREFAESALKCEVAADQAGDYDAALWRGRAASWWKLVTEVGNEYARIAKGKTGPTRPPVLPVNRPSGHRPDLN